MTFGAWLLLVGLFLMVVGLFLCLQFALIWRYHGPDIIHEDCLKCSWIRRKEYKDNGYDE